jgi:hypothetical protein
MLGRATAEQCLHCGSGSEALSVNCSIRRSSPFQILRPHGHAALKMVDGPVAFDDPLRRKASFLKMPIDVGREHSAAMCHPTANFQELPESQVRFQVMVAIPPMPKACAASLRLYHRALI